MLKDITIGQYYGVSSCIHRLDPRAKILLSLVFLVALFTVQNGWGMGLCALLLGLGYLLSRVPFFMLFKSLKPVVPLMAFTGLLNLFFYQGKEVLVSFWGLSITLEGVRFCLLLIARIILLISASSLLTYTTSPIQLTDGIERLLSPLRVFRFPAHELAMMMTLALRFIPTLIEETEKIINAQKARGADLEGGNLMRRIKGLLPIFIPLFVSAFRRAEELAMAMDCRCYHGGEGRTRMTKPAVSWRDAIAALAVCATLAGVICLNLFL